VLVVPKDASLPLLEAIRTTLLFLVSVRLFVNDLVPDLDTELNDLTEATFPGYTASFVPFSTAAAINPSGKALVEADAASTFTGTSSSSEVAYGYYVCDSGQTALYWIERFATPVPFDTAGRFVTVETELTLVSEFSG